MSGEPYSIQRLLSLRKLTRAIADLLRAELKEYLSAIAPLLRPKNVLGDYVLGASKEGSRGSEKALLELQRLYTTVASAKPYHLTNELKPPFEIVSSMPELIPVEYTHVVKSDAGDKAVLMTSPLKWTLIYSDYSPKKLKELLASQNPINDEMHRFVLHYLVLHAMMASSPGTSKLFQGLRFPISSGRLAEFGELPLTNISACVSTIRPPDVVIIESTEISGQNAFEEIVNLEDLQNLEDPLKNQLIELARTHGVELAMSAGS
jgi:hypothetical protein